MQLNQVPLARLWPHEFLWWGGCQRTGMKVRNVTTQDDAIIHVACIKHISMMSELMQFSRRYSIYVVLDEKVWFCYHLPGGRVTCLTKRCDFVIICAVEGSHVWRKCMLLFLPGRRVTWRKCVISLSFAMYKGHVFDEKCVTLLSFTRYNSYMFDENMRFCYHLLGKSVTWLTKMCDFVIICPVKGPQVWRKCVLLLSFDRYKGHMFDETVCFCYHLPGRRVTCLTKMCDFVIICHV